MHKARSREGGGAGRGGEDGGGGGGVGGEVSTFTTLHQPLKIMFGHERWLIKSTKLPNFSV